MLDIPKKIVNIVVVTVSLALNYPFNVSACPAAEQKSTQQTTPTKTAKKQSSHSLKEPCQAELTSEEDYQWMQVLHETVSDSVYQSALWFDNFFIDDSTEQQDPKTSARIRFGWEPKARDLNSFDTRFRINVKLPHFKDKLDLILSDDDENDQSHLPLETANTTETEKESFAAAVRYTHNKSDNKLLESRIGISGGDLFIKTRHKRRFSWENIHSIKIEPSIYYFIDDGLGAKLLLEYDYQSNERTQYRVNYSVRVSESFSGLRWKHGFYKLKQLQQNSASVIGLQVEGERNGERGFLIDKYTLSYRYRFNAVKSWLFFEVEPFLEWPEEKHYKTTPGIALRVEGYFSKG